MSGPSVFRKLNQEGSAWKLTLYDSQRSGCKNGAPYQSGRFYDRIRNCFTGWGVNFDTGHKPGNGWDGCRPWRSGPDSCDHQRRICLIVTVHILFIVFFKFYLLFLALLVSKGCQ
ncbi:hypothetical protein GWI33_013459 [Rhynchophorus ferrugineus]|uniref:Uncharacterized protein n=1 Tax=Rhynchophorus ferrugineus TaxID=354439 RepID=A0A834M9Y2_RHYFE|nr:hypothetical protein GWI33_013459 [Rhynchophorus ferrugineus]